VAVAVAPLTNGATVIVMAMAMAVAVALAPLINGVTVIIVVVTKLLTIGVTVIVVVVAVVVAITINKLARLRGDRDNRSKQNRRASEAVPVAALSNLQQQTLPRDRRGALCELM
jgi:membrane protein implicated in regulation of membrane protease activity